MKIEWRREQIRRRWGGQISKIQKPSILKENIDFCEGHLCDDALTDTLMCAVVYDSTLADVSFLHPHING